VKKLNKPLLFVDLFAGPGKFGDGDPGSPIILTNAAMRAVQAGTHAHVVAIEKDAELVKRLRHNLREHPTIVEVRHGDAINLLSELSQQVKDKTSFIYIDPFTTSRLYVSEIAKLFAPLREGDSVEVLIVLMVPQILRWARQCLVRESGASATASDAIAADASEARNQVLDDLVHSEEDRQAANSVIESAEKLNAIAGGTYWRQLASGIGQIEISMYDEFVHRYCQALEEWFGNTLAFPIYAGDTSRVPKYWLVWGTRYRQAIDLMNDAMASARESEQEAHETLFKPAGYAGPSPVSLTDLVPDILREGPLEWREVRWRVMERVPGQHRRRDINAFIKSRLHDGRLTGAAGDKIDELAIIRMP